MSNVVSMSCTCDYLLNRADKHRCAGRYDDAMALLWKAKSQFGLHEDIEMAFGHIYDELDCENEASRAYLRVVHLGGEHKAQALFQLSMSAFERGDLGRAASYFEHFSEEENHDDISSEMSVLLGKQILEGLESPAKRTRKHRARLLEQRAARLLQEGKTAGAQCAIRHALALRPRAQSYTMLACCCLIRGLAKDAVDAAQMAHRFAPSNVQTLCVLTDAYAAAGLQGLARKALSLAALRANAPEDLFAVAIESAKNHDDRLTLLLTKKLLRREQNHTRALMLRACALSNLGRTKDANRLFARLSVLLPEDTICESYFRMTRHNTPVGERLTLCSDVTRDEGVRRASELIAALSPDTDTEIQDEVSLSRLLRLCEWAFHSPMAGMQIKTAAFALLNEIDDEKAYAVLCDVLTDPQLADGLKLCALQILTKKTGFKPYYVDLGGKLVRLAAGGMTEQPVRASEVNPRIVQRACDALCGRHPDAPQMMLDAFLLYLKTYGQPPARHEDACAAALEYLYLARTGHKSDAERMMKKRSISKRLVRVYLKRFDRCLCSTKG